ncbi:alkaline phosphatase-like protein [Hesseltinella vesiculosa]|uniref:Alkaline phosphatase-like protein n=1 Tax=Hesseltinella vesiculosa TaxID=101127 RepID=A0A1X2GGS3_9FUNG|nr:alkaline phosphatase-like protein [Hesseltinella vesiculosa]
MYPSFPSLTFPNHWTLVTGVYPETHGIVANDFFDPVLGETFRHSSLNSTTNATWWTTVDPIWKTCQQHNRMSATIMWPGSAAIEADFVADFNSTTMPMEKIDMVMELIDLPYLKRPQFYSVYMHHVDTAGHVHGPSKDGVATAVQQVDQAVGYLMEQLKARNLDKHANVVIVSDHGMAKTDKYMYYDDILPGDLIDRLQHREAWPLLDLRPLPDAPANTSLQIFDAFHQFQQLHPDKAHYQVFLKEDIPEKFHYSHHDRIAPVIVLPDPGYAFVSHNLADPTSGVPSQPAGMHGYDPFDEDMWAIFMAAGPKIDKAYPSSKRLAPFGNVEVYEVLTELMNINANPNNGSFHGYLPTL